MENIHIITVIRGRLNTNYIIINYKGESMNQIPEFSFEGRPLTQEESAFFIKLSLNADKEKNLKESSINKEFLAQVLLKRIQGYNLKFEISDFFFIISVLCFANNPGKIMILLRLCFQYWLKTERSFLGISEWVDIFPSGVPTEKELEQMWDSQKFSEAGVMTDNLVDCPSLWVA